MGSVPYSRGLIVYSRHEITISGLPVSRCVANTTYTSQLGCELPEPYSPKLIFGAQPQPNLYCWQSRRDRRIFPFSVLKNCRGVLGFFRAVRARVTATAFSGSSRVRFSPLALVFCTARCCSDKCRWFNATIPNLEGNATYSRDVCPLVDQGGPLLE